MGNSSSSSSSPYEALPSHAADPQEHLNDLFVELSEADASPTFFSVLPADVLRLVPPLSLPLIG